MTASSNFFVGRCLQCRKAQQLFSKADGFGFQACECGSNHFWEVNHYKPMKRPGSWTRSVRRLALKYSLFFFFGHLIALLGTAGFLVFRWLEVGVHPEAFLSAFVTGVLLGFVACRAVYEAGQ